jgi:hypothetical protein
MANNMQSVMDTREGGIPVRGGIETEQIIKVHVTFYLGRGCLEIRDSGEDNSRYTSARPGWVSSHVR